ncbi:uncharacterized protein TNCV_777551 [Trichonephila clavipes]|nr:uncharacterized protein TNCV_777551 [Trichonephila clavipes]
MFKNCRKEDLRIVALELGETVAEKVTIVELTEIIKENKYFKEDVEFVKELIQYTIEDHNERTGEGCNTLDALVKSVRILTVKVPNRPEVRLKKVASHISVRAGNDWFRPLELAKEIDLYNTSRGKSLKTLPNVLTRNNPVKNASREYEDLGHMREIKADGSGVSFYMPHHGVYRPEKSTTKMRTVFNASSPSTSGKSLNSIQFNGGLVQEDLFSIMVRFRKHKRANKTYELTTVTYGTVSAPYLATRTLKQLAMDEANNFPLAAPVVLSDCYMDDILSGSESIEENRATKANFIHQKNGFVCIARIFDPLGLLDRS